MTTPENTPLRPNRYVRKVLLSNETLLHQTRLHIIIFAKPAFFALIALILSVTAFRYLPNLPTFVRLLPIAVAVIVLLVPYICRVHSEFAVTDTRVILKTGFLRQTSLDLQWKSIGGVSVDQTLFGRIFKYGTIGVFGTSAGQKFSMVSDPFAFKRAVEEMIQNNARRNAN